MTIFSSIIGDTKSFEYNGRPVTFEGAGNHTACQSLFQGLIYNAVEKRCFPKSCAIGPVYQPSIEAEDEFYAISAFLYAMEEIGAWQENGDIVTSDHVTEKGQLYCTKVRRFLN